MLQDIRFVTRQLVKRLGFGIVAVLTLALAIGASTAIFSAVDAVLLHPLAYPDPDRLVIVSENLPHYGLGKLAPSFSEFLEYRRTATCFSQIAAVTGGDATLTGEGQPEEIERGARPPLRHRSARNLLSIKGFFPLELTHRRLPDKIRRS